MKRLFLALGLLMVWTATAVAQQNCVDLQEIDGSPRAPCVKKILVTNGTLTCSSTNVCTLTTGGGSGSPGGLAGQVQWNDTGAFNGTSGLTATATTVTIVSGVTATFSRAGLLYTGTVTTDNASVQTMLLQGDRATPTGNDEAYITYRLSNAAGTQTEVARMTWAIPTATAASEDGRIDWSVMTGGALAKALQLSGADLAPSTNDGLALGTAANQFSDLFLANGAVIDFANGNAVLTHSSGILTVSTGDLRVTSAGTNATSVATLSASQTLTNKTLATGTAFAGFSDIATIAAPTNPSAGNIRLYADSGTGNLTCLTSAGGNCLPGGSSSLVVGTTAVTSGTAGRLFYEMAGNLFGEISGATSNGTSVTFTSGNLLATSPAFTTNQTTTNDAIGATSTDGIILQNTTAAAAGAQQYSPRIRLTGQGWKTTATAASQTVDWVIENVPVQGATNPTTTLLFRSQVNGGGYGTIVTLNSNGGGMTLAGSLNAQSGRTFGQGGAVIGGSDSITWTGRGILTSIAAGSIIFGTADAASPVAQTLSVQNVVAGTTNTAGATATIRGSLGTSQGAPGRIHLTGGALIAASGTTQQTAVDRFISGATKVLTNNSAINIVSAAVATETNAAGVIDYTVEVLDGTDVQYEVGSVAYGVSNKGGVFSGNTATKFGNHQNATSGTLTVTFAISGANPALLSVNANSSLTPSTGYPRITYTLRNLTQQSVTIQ